MKVLPKVKDYPPMPEGTIPPRKTTSSSLEKPKYEMYLPWAEPPLDEWDIIGMNHYHIQDCRCLFVAMTKGNRFIISEGPSDELVFIDLKRKAKLSSGKFEQSFIEGKNDLAPKTTAEG